MSQIRLRLMCCGDCLSSTLMMNHLYRKVSKTQDGTCTGINIKNPHSKNLANDYQRAANIKETSQNKFEDDIRLVLWIS